MAGHAWKPLKSSMISAHSYDAASKELKVRFNGGKEYTHHDVPPEIAHGLAGAPSAGKFFNANLKGKYTKPEGAK